jgi:hypothetical protein
MIVKSYKSRSEQSEGCLLLSAENLQAYKRAQYLKQYTSFRKPRRRNKTKSTQLVNFNDKLNGQK